jgi:hypothetical protein
MTQVAIGDNSAFTISIANVTNPAIANYPANSFTVSTSSDGTASDASAGVAFVSSSVPGAPTSPSVTAGTGQATLSWTAPTSNGGSAITGYDVTLRDAYSGVYTYDACPSLTISSATQCVVTSLTGGDDYTFEVEAINAVGDGADSAFATPVMITAPSSGGGGGGGSGGSGTGGGGSTPPSGGGGSSGGTSGSSGGTTGGGVKPVVTSASGSLKVGKSGDVILAGTGFQAGAKVVSNAKGVKISVHSVSADRVVLAVVASALTKSGTYHVTILNKDGKGDSIEILITVNKHTEIVTIKIEK